MSSKGQIVIPQQVRKDMHLSEGSLFAVAELADAIILKKMNKPTKEELLSELGKLAEEGQKKMEKSGIKEKDIPKMIEAHRRRMLLS